MLKTTALAVSALVNVALGVLWLAGPRGEAALQQPVPRLVAAHGDFARWLALGLPEHEAKRLLFATLESAAVGAIANPWERYWQAGDLGGAYARALTEAYGQVRRDLERDFGVGAAGAPEFGRAFRPLEAQFAFLSSAEQIELQQRRLQSFESRANHTALDSPLTDAARRSSRRPLALDFLNPAAAFEVALRDSPRAEQLRRSGVGLEEHEFREVFELLERLDKAADLATQTGVRRQLRALLGGSRFVTVTATRDPLFGVLERVGGEHDLDAAAIAAAYEVLSNAQGQLLELAAAGFSGERAIAEAAAIAAAERERLDAVVGEAAATAIRAAREELYRSAQRVAAATPRLPGP